MGQCYNEVECLAMGGTVAGYCEREWGESLSQVRSKLKYIGIIYSAELQSTEPAFAMPATLTSVPICANADLAQQPAHTYRPCKKNYG